MNSVKNEQIWKRNCVISLQERYFLEAARRGFLNANYKWMLQKQQNGCVLRNVKKSLVQALNIYLGR
jgi:hypothetical protein